MRRDELAQRRSSERECELVSLPDGEAPERVEEA